MVDRASERPINSIGVEGQFVYITRQAVSGMGMPMIVNGFLQSPLPAIKTKLEANPWIARAAVSRRWPDKLFISIVEEQPIARWGQNGFLNHKGDIVRIEESVRLRSLPLLSGNKGQEKLVMQSYQQLAQMLRPHDLKISEFHSDELLSWYVILTNGLKINIGRDQTMEKMQRFLNVYQRDLHRRLDEIAAVDLRYGNGLAVEWKTATVKAVETTKKQDEKA
ncbi:MAG: cell division protein FtsQ/DivIB [Cellvibrionaceae bacterium]